MEKQTIKEKVASGRPLDAEVIIDAHCHMGRWHNFNIPQCGADEMVAMMNRLGIRACVVSHHSSIGPDFRYGNDEVIRAMKEFPGRIYGYVGVNPNYPENELIEELDRCLSAGMVGIKLHPDMHQCAVDDARYTPVWEYADRNCLPVLSHTSTGGRNPVKTFEKLAESYPNAKIILGHSGFGSEGADQSIELALEFPNVYLEIAGSVIVYGTLERMVRHLGANRVLFGSDMPFLDPRPQVGRVAFAKISDDEKRQIFGLNALNVFQLKGL